MRKALSALAVLLFASTLFAQSSNTTTFAWFGSTDTSQLIELATINGQDVNQATGYAGAIQITNRDFLWLLDLPQSLGLPNNGYLDCASQITWGAPEWQTGDGSHAGDLYTLTGTTSCLGANISLTEYRQMVAHRYCRYSVCRTTLVDTMESGAGTVTVEPTAATHCAGPCGS